MINWSEAGHKTAKVLLTIIYVIRSILHIIPLLLGLFPLIQIGLWISKYILPHLPWFEWGWNNKFLESLPLVLQPGHPWASFCLLITMTSICIAITQGYDDVHDNRLSTAPIWFLILMNTLTYGILYCLFIIPEKTIAIIGWIGIFSYCIIAIRFPNCSHYSVSSNYDDEDEDIYEQEDIYDDYIPRRNKSETKSYTYDEPKQSKSFWQESRSERREETKPQVHNPEITYRIKVAKQITSNRVDVKVIEYRDGIEYGSGFTWGKAGVLQNWTSDSVVIKDGTIYRQYNIRGGIINSWQERR